ncbi:hypothetical protein V8E52_011011 [Russula decolorans]
MAKSTKSKAVKSSPKKSRAESSTIETKKTGRQRRKAATATTTTHEPQQPEASEDDELEEPATDTLTLKIPARVVWDKYPECTERLLDYLDAHPDVAMKLFGDSTQTAKLEGRSKMTAKSNKAAAYLQVADGIFSVDHDPGVRADFASNPNKYSKAVDNYITNTLKKQYRAANKRIGKTGAGLKAEDISPGSEIANIIEKETENFRWWPWLHGFWRMLPNFNPYTVSSDPGQDLADEALSVLMGGHASGRIDLALDEGDPYSLRTTPDIEDVLRSAGSTSVTPFTPLTSTTGTDKVKAEAPSKTPSRAGTPKSRLMLKRALQDAFAEGSAKENQVLERLGTQKHERAIGELELKRRKLENKAMEKQHQREREREQHEFRMMQMRMMMSQQSVSTRLPSMMQPQNQPSLEGFGLMAELNAAVLPSESPSPLSPFSI